MKFAFSTLAAPGLDLPTLALRAKEAGYDGIDLAAPPKDLGAGKVIADAGLEVACIGSAIQTPHGRRARARAAGELRALLGVAADLGCRRVRISVGPSHVGVSAASAGVEMAQWLAPLADAAGEAQVTILIRNDATFRKSRDLWLMLESINHPNVAACWDLAAGLRAGETPYVSVPTLNSRIQYALLPDTVSAETAAFVTRLSGIGYGGYVAIAGATADLSRDLSNLREWTKPPVIKAPASKAAVRASAPVRQ